MEQPICLDLGSGEFPVNLASHQIVRVDIRPETNPHICCDLHRIPLPDQSVDAIYCGHILEHFSFRETDSLLREWLRLVKHKGDIVIKVPNLKFACEMILLDDLSFDPMSIVYGSHEHVYQFHYNGFTVKSLHDLMMKHGCQGTCTTISEGREICYEGIRYYL